jgi:hypothetical protein
MPKIIFLKTCYYNGKKFNKDTILDMPLNTILEYKKFGKVKFYFGEKKKLEDLSYNELQKLCKKKKIKAVGKKEDLLKVLKSDTKF